MWIDAHAFEQLVESGLRASREGQHEIALSLLDRALELYGGDFLADDLYEDWAMVERERIRALVENAARKATEICEQRRDLHKSLEYARWLAELERYDSDVQLRLIRLCLTCGRRSEAARRYNAFRSRLIRDFGQEPEFDLATAAVGAKAASA